MLIVPPGSEAVVRVTVDEGATYVKRVLAKLVPWGLVTNTLAGPAAPAGVTAVIVVESTTAKLVAAVPPTLTAVAPKKFVPVIVMAVPPSVLPLEGARLETVGGEASNPTPVTTTFETVWNSRLPVTVYGPSEVLDEKENEHDRPGCGESM